MAKWKSIRVAGHKGYRKLSTDKVAVKTISGGYKIKKGKPIFK